jgi:AcrR family transcriptional regulator
MSVQELDRRQQILDAAVRAFAKYGFHKASIKQIAKEAKLKSPALIYWYFKDKDDLFRAMLQMRSPLLSQVSDSSQLQRIMERSPEEVLAMVARSYFVAFDNPDTVRLFRIFLSEATRYPDVANVFAKNGPAAALKFLAAYLRHQVKLGALRSHNAESAARAFMGVLLMYMLSREIFPPLRENLPEIENYVNEIVSIFLRGLRAA